MDRFRDRFGSVGDVELLEGVLEMVLERVDADAGEAGDFGVLENPSKATATRGESMKGFKPDWTKG